MSNKKPKGRSENTILPIGRRLLETSMVYVVTNIGDMRISNEVIESSVRDSDPVVVHATRQLIRDKLSKLAIEVGEKIKEVKEEIDEITTDDVDEYISSVVMPHKPKDRGKESK